MTAVGGNSPATPDNSIIASVMVFIERYLLSVAYLYLAGRIMMGALNHNLGWTASGGVLNPSLAEAATDVLLFLMQLFVGLVLISSSRPTTIKPTLTEIFVPLATASFFLAYNYVRHFPDFMQRNLYPTVWPDSMWSLNPVDALALLCGLIGPAISIWGVVTLRRSFGIFVSVREVVLRGPYRWVRHPIYLGYIFIYGGLVLFDRSLAVLTIALIHLSLFVWRAHLEEARLSAFSPAYAEHMKHSGFLFPKIFSRS